jgi:hypothetical protein
LGVLFWVSFFFSSFWFFFFAHSLVYFLAVLLEIPDLMHLGLFLLGVWVGSVQGLVAQKRIDE